MCEIFLVNIHAVFTISCRKISHALLSSGYRGEFSDLTYADLLHAAWMCQVQCTDYKVRVSHEVFLIMLDTSERACALSPAVAATV